jgi:hypothetical protein
VLGINGPDPAFRDDDGSADAGVSRGLREFAAGQGSEQEALTALARSRLLVPIVAVLAEQVDEPGQDRMTADDSGPGITKAEKASEMAMPTLIGLDGRRAIPVFTCMESMRAWQQDARPVPMAARRVWEAALADTGAVIVDVAGPVPLAVEGARLAALAHGEAVPAPCFDADVRQVVSDVLAGQETVIGFELRPGGAEHDLVIALTMSGQGSGRDVTDVAAVIGTAVMERLGGRLRRGIAIWLDDGAAA